MSNWRMLYWSARRRVLRIRDHQHPEHWDYLPRRGPGAADLRRDSLWPRAHVGGRRRLRRRASGHPDLGCHQPAVGLRASQPHGGVADRATRNELHQPELLYLRQYLRRATDPYHVLAAIFGAIAIVGLLWGLLALVWGARHPGGGPRHAAA